MNFFFVCSSATSCLCVASFIESFSEVNVYFEFVPESSGYAFIIIRLTFLSRFSFYPSPRFHV